MPTVPAIWVLIAMVWNVSEAASTQEPIHKVEVMSSEQACREAASSVTEIWREHTSNYERSFIRCEPRTLYRTMDGGCLGAELCLKESVMTRRRNEAQLYLS